MAGNVRAAYHFWDINEIYSNEDGSVQFIELIALGGGQQFMANAVTIRATNSVVTNSFLCPTNLPEDTFNRTCIFGTSNLLSVPGGVAPNYIIPPNFIPPALSPGSGAVIFLPAGFPAQQVAAAYTNLPTDGDSALVRSGGSFVVTPTNTPRNFNNESNTIVPLKFLSAQVNDTNFVMTFRTATGVNGSAGPNYTAEYKNSPDDISWTPLTTVGGDGTTKSAANALSESPQRIFRLRVP